MSSSLTALAFRWPGPVAGRASNLVRCCPKASSASLSTASRPTACLVAAQAPLPPVSRQSRTAALPSMPQVLSRAKHSLAYSAARSQLVAVHASRSTTAPTTSSVASTKRNFASAAASQSAETPALDWNSFFKLRLRRRRVQLLFSVTTSLGGGAAGAILLSTGLAEPLVLQVPLDPFATLGLITLACTAMGWLVGPTIGNQAFYLMNRRLKTQMMQKESQFFTRVKKNRADPTSSSAGNPVPDFYGEKIQSVSGYRQWLKDQRAFNKKKTRAFV